MVKELSLISIVIHTIYNGTCIAGVMHTFLATGDSCCCMFGSEVGPAGYQQGHIDGLSLISIQCHVIYYGTCIDGVVYFIPLATEDSCRCRFGS